MEKQEMEKLKYEAPKLLGLGAPFSKGDNCIPSGSSASTDCVGPGGAATHQCDPTGSAGLAVCGPTGASAAICTDGSSGGA